MKLHVLVISILLFCVNLLFAQSPSFETYVNPVIPGDHPDPTLTKIGDYFYTSGSSFNPTPRIYRSSNLVHWEVIAQPVKPNWSVYGNNPSGGVWGGHTVLYNGTYWHYFGRGGGSMYFVTADNPEGPWSDPTRVNVPAGLPGLGVDNSIFIDDDGKWYMLAKPGRDRNTILELGDNGQPINTLDISWLNPEGENGYPYGWAEGPVMWKYNGYYYYSFAENLAGVQYVMRSDTLSTDQEDWEVKPEPMNFGQRGSYNTPNHISPAVLLDDSTSWVIGHSHQRNWDGQGRQGLLLEITYDEDGFPEFAYPLDEATTAPALPSEGVSWMVPKSDMFDSSVLNPDWSFLGEKTGSVYSLDNRPGWLHLIAGSRSRNTLIKNDGEHQYTLITRVDVSASSSLEGAGLQIINGSENLSAKILSTADASGNPEFVFSFDRRDYDEPNEIGSIVWLKLERIENEIAGYYSADGHNWTQVGRNIDVTDMNISQDNICQFYCFTGNKQGLYTQGTSAYFDLYIYRDAYSSIWGQDPANYSGVDPKNDALEEIVNGGWAMYGGVEFGKEELPEVGGFDYQRTPDKIVIEASSESGGLIEIWIDSLDTGTKISEIQIASTGDLNTFQEFEAPVDSISGRHDLYLKFSGSEGVELFNIQNIRFTPKRVPIPSATNSEDNTRPVSISLNQNYPNPFNPNTTISYYLPEATQVSLTVYNVLGQKVATLADGFKLSGSHTVTFEASRFTSGVYFYELKADEFYSIKKMTLIK